MSGVGLWDQEREDRLLLLKPDDKSKHLVHLFVQAEVLNGTN